MSIENLNIDNRKSLLSRRWKLNDFDERNVIYFSQKYNLKYTPTYVLVDSTGEKIYKRVGNFNIEKFNSIIS